MSDEIMLKQKYNDLLKSLKTGEEFIKANSDNEDAKKRLEEIGNEIQNIMKMFPDMTSEEMEKGFDIVGISTNIEIPTQTQVDEQAAAQIVQTTTTTQPTQKMIVKSDNITNNFENNWEIAERLSKSSLLPDEFKGKPENTIIALGMSQKMGMDFFTIAQNLHVIRGKLSWSGAFCKTLIEQSGKYTDLDFVYFGKEGTDDRGCYLEATRTRDGKKIQGNKVTVKLAKDEKWWNTNSKWRTMTDQMLGYRAAAFFARLYCGEVLNGIMTTEENMDIDIQKQQPQDIL